MINIKSFVQKLEAEARFAGNGGASEITCIFIYFFIRVEFNKFVLFCFLGRCAKIVFACRTDTLQRHFSV